VRLDREYIVLNFRNVKYRPPQPILGAVKKMGPLDVTFTKEAISSIPGANAINASELPMMSNARLMSRSAGVNATGSISSSERPSCTE
jgi:hypothetical protein